MPTSTRTRILVNILLFAAVLVFNYLANALPLGGRTTGEISDQYKNYFTPAGLTFSIWGVIYLWLGAWIVFQVIALLNPARRSWVDEAVEKHGWWLSAALACNIAWLLAWHNGLIGLSVVIMLAYLVSMIRLNLSAGVGSSAVDPREKWVAHAGFGLHFGWITVATIANITTLLLAFGWEGGGLPGPTWAIILIVVAAAVSIAVIRSTGNVFHGLAVAWGLFGIYWKNQQPDGQLTADSVAWTALGAALAVAAVAALGWRRWAGYADQ
jgi:hypothetical protein